MLQPKVKLLCSVLSLPTPLNSASSGQEEAHKVATSVPSKLEKLLMVGYDKSGTSTIFKQVLFSSKLILYINIELRFHLRISISFCI